MPSKDVEALAGLARLCSEVRAKLPESGFHRLRVLLDMILIDLAREGIPAEAGTRPQQAGEPELPLPQNSA